MIINMDKLEIALRVIHPNWQPIIKKNILELHSALSHIVDDTAELTPNLEDIFNAFRIDPQHIRVVIMGQRPYSGHDPKSKEKIANGLSFSTNTQATPMNLKKIFSCLNRLNYKTDSNDLMPWLLQGVFLLNTDLTRHVDIWKPFIINIIADLSLKYKTNNLTFILWGDAQKIEPHLKGKPNILKWSYPSSAVDTQLEDSKKFINCDNFDRLKHINWNTGEQIIIYTDGGGYVQGKCSFGVYWTNILKMGGVVGSYEYELTDRINSTDIDKTPTPQRGEYLAISYALWIVYKFKFKNAIIVTDSRNAKGIITEWTKREEDKYKNVDLVKIMRRLYEPVRKYVEIIHILSHGKGDTIYNEGNAIADKIATEYLNKDIALECKYLGVDFNLFN